LAGLATSRNSASAFFYIKPWMGPPSTIGRDGAAYAKVPKYV
jgi:hypothetical protein